VLLGRWKMKHKNYHRKEIAQRAIKKSWGMKLGGNVKTNERSWRASNYHVDRDEGTELTFGAEVLCQSISQTSRPCSQGPLLPVLSRSRGREVVSVMSRVLSSSGSGKKSDWLSGRSLPILKMEFIQQMHSSERKQMGDREDWLTPSSSSSVASGSYPLFHILQLNYKANDPETHFKYVRAFIQLSCKDLSA